MPLLLNGKSREEKASIAVDSDEYGGSSTLRRRDGQKIDIFFDFSLNTPLICFDD